MEKLEKLFEPIQVGPIEIKNRIAMAPMNVALHDPRGYASERQICYYAARARGGFGLIITEAGSTSPLFDATTQYFNMKLYEPEHVFGWRNLVDAIHAFDARAIIQLAQGCGRQGFDPKGKKQPIAPSPIPYEIDPKTLPKGFDKDPFMLGHLKGQMPREITKEEIGQLIESYYTSTRLAIQAGFDGVEIHACHGYLGHEFLSPNMNKRTDEWGGSFENRIRFVVESVKAAIQAVQDFGVGDRFVVGCRTSAQEHTEGGFTMEDMVKFHQTLAKLGSSYVNLSDGPGYEGLKYFFPPEEDMPLKEEEAKFFKGNLDIPVIVPSIHDPVFANRVAKEGDGIIIALGRQAIADPDWPNKVKEGRLKDISKCIRCNKGCLLQYGLAYMVGSRCMVNPNMGREIYQMENWPPPMKRGKYLR